MTTVSNFKFMQLSKEYWLYKNIVSYQSFQGSWLSLQWLLLVAWNPFQYLGNPVCKETINQSGKV